MTDGGLDADYATAGFGGTLEMGERPALLIVDLCRAYIDSASPLRLDGAAAVTANQRLAAAARVIGVPVIMTRVVYGPGRDGGLFYRKVPALACFDAGSPLAELPAGFQTCAGDRIIEKQFPSAFFGTGLAEDLRTDGIDTLFITGFSTSGCVRATALDALCHGFVPIVIADACADRDRRPHEANLFDLEQKYAEVIDTTEALARIRALA